MADFARTLAAVDRVTGWDTLAAYLDAAAGANDTVLEADPVADARTRSRSTWGTPCPDRPSGIPCGVSKAADPGEASPTGERATTPTWVMWVTRITRVVVAMVHIPMLLGVIGGVVHRNWVTVIAGTVMLMVSIAFNGTLWKSSKLP